MAARIFKAARRQLLEVWDFTEQAWGEKQADSYVRGLVDTVNAAHRKRHQWRPVGDATLGEVFFIRYRHHYIFFRELTDGTPGVISILHENMDIPSRLKEDTGADADDE